MAGLQKDQLDSVASTLTSTLDTLNIDYAVMGGVAVCLLANDPTGITEDVDLVIHVDDRGITADQLTSLLIENSPSDFAPVLQFGHTIPGYKLSLPGGDVRLVEVEAFDYQSWPQRPKYNIPSSTRRSIIVNGQTVKTFSPEWIFRGKTLSQHQREGSPKGLMDINDINRMIPMLTPGKPDLDFDCDIRLESALRNLPQKRSLLSARLKGLVKCTTVFG